MAAIGGDTVVPTDWRGLIGVVVLVSVIAAVTYFGLHMSEGNEVEQQDDSLSVQEVFSSAANREVAAAEPARALPRAGFSAPAATPATNAPSATDAPTQADTAAADDWDAPPADEDEMATEQAATHDQDAPAPVRDQPAKKQVVAANKPAASRPAAREAEPAVIDARPRPAAEALVAWWKEAGDGLQVRFAGTLDRGGKVSDGVAVMFGEAVAPAQADKYLKLTDASGKTVGGRWQIGANPTLLMLQGLDQGRYRLSIGAGLPGESGKTLAKTVEGPIFVY